MALTWSRGFVGQVRGVSHHGQEIHLHPKAGYIDADFLSSIKLFPCIQAADHTFRQLRFDPSEDNEPAHGGSALLDTARIIRGGENRSAALCLALISNFIFKGDLP
jgi:hypothetical protein